MVMSLCDEPCSCLIDRRWVTFLEHQQLSTIQSKGPTLSSCLDLLTAVMQGSITGPL